jgi:ubiquinone/menaquinone biosynthesis C-methylase UbiE
MAHGPDPREARNRYDEMSPEYDHHLGQQLSRIGRYLEGIRKSALSELQVRPGQTVIDVGCGTGASFARLVKTVGRDGRVIGVDQSPGMLAVAARRTEQEGWTNVELIEAPVQEARLPKADAALLFFTHDLLRTPAALDNVVSSVCPGGRIVAAGMKRPSMWLAPIALAVQLIMSRYVTTDEGQAKPWDLLADRLENLSSKIHLLGAIYIVAGSRFPESAGSGLGGR